MNVQAINYLKKYAHAALQNRKFGVAKGLCRAEFSKNVDTSFQESFVVVETQKLSFYIEKNKNLEKALKTVDKILKKSGKSIQELKQEFNSSRRKNC